MINLFNYFIEANVILLVFALVYYSLLAKQSNFQFRRFFILFGAVSALIVPFISVSLDQNIFSVNLVPSTIATIILDEVVIGGELDGSFFSFLNQHWSFYGLLCYVLISSLLLTGFLNQLLSIKKIFSDQSATRSKQRGYTLVETSDNYPTFSFFGLLIFRNCKKISETERAQIIAHEEVHIRQWHSLDVVLLEMMRVLFWINPGTWFFRKSQAENHEYIVDEEILRYHDRSDYQQLLIKMTVDQVKLVGNYFAKIQTLKRIDMMNEKRKKPNRLKMATALLSALLVVTVLACNEGLVETVKTSEMALEMPSEIQADLETLKKEHPNWKWIYRELDAPNGEPTEEIADFVISNRVSSMHSFKDRDKIGLLIRTTSLEEFNMVAELTKSADEVFDIVEDQPAPPNGMPEFYRYIGANMKYPAQARSMGIEGRVFVQFIVDKEGNLTKVVPLKGIGAGCDQEAVRVIQNAPKWIPGKQRGETVSVRMILPITFKLGDSGPKLKSFDTESQEISKSKKLEEIVVVGRKK